MATKTVDGTGAENGTGAKTDEEQTAPEAEGPVTGEAPGADSDVLDDDERTEDPRDAGSGDSVDPGVGQGAAAVVSAALGIVSLTGSWVGTVASARESLMGQLQTSQSSSVATMVREGYGDAWNANALWAGLFALAALVVGVVVLARPAFGAPGRPQAPWIKSVSWAGVSLGVLGLVLAVLKYTDVLLGLPATS
ncbi:membrane protein [Streptomyces sp. AS58]|uniref:Uncharacterized protein n=1 Tax=Streptomyces cadmiisoli TaxID=2184053 RepID=A0A2Z4IX83_9ACTN|nr:MULTISPECIES: hypothetical protein [Streptomyces]AWW37407.1 hypothetical protein DN051_12765 [Streptomyces cadmiisoli]KOV64328.1 membrane protein [Streptomyces sp. AS58]